MEREVLVGKPKRKSSLEKPRRRWEGNIKMGAEETELETWKRLGCSPANSPKYTILQGICCLPEKRPAS